MWRSGSRKSDEVRTGADSLSDFYGKLMTKTAQGFIRISEEKDLKNKIARIFNQAGEFIGVRPSLIPVGFVLILLTFFGIFDRIITNSVGFFYPAWQSFKAIETSSPDDDRQWLTYWVVYSFFTLLELFADHLLFWVPMYYAFKIIFLLWLFLPQYHGALTIYSNILRPLLLQHQRTIDGVLARVSQTLEPEELKKAI